MKAVHLVPRCAVLIAAVSAATLVPTIARAQVGTGGTTAAGGTLAGTDLFLSVQKDQGVNLNDLNRARFLNRASCQCKTQAWLKAVVLPSAVVRANAVSSSASVSMYIGNQCDQAGAVFACCHRLKSVPFSQFRLSGLEAETNVEDLTRIWSNTSGNCGDSRAPDNAGTGATSGTGGVSGTGGAGGTGGTAGSGGVGGVGGAAASTGGTVGTGGVTGTGGTTGSTLVGPCTGTAFTQTLWVFVGTAGEGSHDIATASLGFSVDPEPPIAPTLSSIAPANEALLLKWNALAAADAADLTGYQVLCTRGDATQVFKTGTFTAAFDSCAGTSTGEWPVSELPQSMFACSDLLSAAATSYRLKILENGITYGVGVAAIDRQGNASVIQPMPGVPVETKDFYSVYRHGDPQGGATGGYCAISGDTSTGLTTAAALGAAVLLGALAVRRRRPPPRRRP